MGPGFLQACYLAYSLEQLGSYDASQKRPFRFITRPIKPVMQLHIKYVIPKLLTAKFLPFVLPFFWRCSWKESSGGLCTSIKLLYNPQGVL